MNNKHLRLIYKRAEKQYNIAGVIKYLASDKSINRPALLISGSGFAEYGRWTFLAFNPEATFTSNQGNCCFEDFKTGHQETTTKTNPFNYLENLLEKFTIDKRFEKTAPFPFSGGWIGAFSYELLHYIEEIPDKFPKPIGMPEIYLAFYPSFIAYDNYSGKFYLSTLLAKNESEHDAEKELKLLESVLETSQTFKNEKSFIPATEKNITSDFSRDEYESAVSKVIEYIYAGDIFQANLSQRFTVNSTNTPNMILARLTEKSPAPFAAYIEFNGKAIISSSPERFLFMKNSFIETRPIKGTRPRGKNKAEDDIMREQLLSSEKDKAELNMITDLIRNDLGRVCKYGSVKVEQQRLLDEYQTVFHTSSIVTGKLAEEKSIIDLLKATFPGGSITGAPKIRAMEIISELEKSERSFYTGAIGYIGIDQTIDLNIAIRTLIFDGEKYTFNVGGGIVADSIPADEYMETMHKAEGILRAFGISK